jgi:hypothetical protein
MPGRRRLPLQAVPPGIAPRRPIPAANDFVSESNQ